MRLSRPFMSYFTRLMSVVSLTLGAMSVSSLASADEVGGLAQGCFAIQSPDTGLYLAKRSLPFQERYYFYEESEEDAAHFFFKPAEQDVFLLTDKDGRYLSSNVPFAQIATDEPGLHSEWRIYDTEGFYSLRNRFTFAKLRHTYRQGVEGNPLRQKTVIYESHFRLIPQTDCRPYPEMSLAAQPVGEPENAENSARLMQLMTGDVNEPVRGYIDAHSHMGSNLYLAGAIPGDPFHPYGVEHALDACADEHGPNGRLDIIGGGGKVHDTTGWPAFNDWPAHDSLGHSAYYYKWLERAHLSGLRMMVVYMVENRVLCQIQKTVNPAGWDDASGRCDSMSSVLNQIDAIDDLVAYVDAQNGGPGQGFLAAVTTPAEAREAIAAGKLALLYGVEVSEVLNCGEQDNCTQSTIDERLATLHDAGVRVMYPVHKFDNHFGGANTRNSADELVHLGQRVSTGHYVETENCDDHTAEYGGEPVRGFVYDSGIPAVPELPDGVIGDIINDAGPVYPEDEEQCNRKGLTADGEYLVNRMIDRGMIIDLDHISTRAAVSIMDIAEARNHSGVVSTHHWMMRGKDGPEDTDRSDDPLHETFQRLVRAGGFISPLNKDSDTMIAIMEEYLITHLQADYPGLTPAQLLALLPTLQVSDIPGVGLGADMSGLARQAAPKGKNPGYPFVNEFGIQFDQQGEADGRQFDLAVDGVAHYGMLADHVAQIRQDTQQQGKPYVYESLMNSAEQYLQMWEAAEQNAL